MPMTCFLQPVLSLREHRLVGVEALARMYDQGALLLPADFFKKGRKAAGDNWEVQCISSAFAQFMQIEEVLRSTMLLFVNIDPSWLFGKDNAYNDFLDLCKRFAISPTQIIIELAEASLATIPLQGEERFEQVILQLRQAGCLFAVDGVGKGQVSLLYLTRVRPDIIKIAPDMVHDIFTDANRQRLLGTITTLAHQIGSQVVAVGVEKNSDGVTCNHYNVDLLQGYLIGVPSPAVQDDFASLQESWENTLHSYGVSSIKTISRKKQRLARYKLAVQNMGTELDPERLEESLQQVYQACKKDFPEMECAYIIDRDGVQLTNTIGFEERAGTVRNRFYRPALKGSFHSLKPYFLTINAGADQYFSPAYISQATGELCLTHAQLLSGYMNNALLCADFRAPLWDQV